MRCRFSALFAVATCCTALAQPLTTAFTYQGRLDSAGAPAAGTFDFKFSLFDAASGGAQLGPQLCVDNLAVTAGVFVAELDFGAQFAGSQRFLEIWVRQDTGLSCLDNGGFTILSPRQPLTGSPNALYALAAASATTATNASLLSNQPAAFYTNASNLASGTVPDLRLSVNLLRANAAQEITGPKAFDDQMLQLYNPARTFFTTLRAVPTFGRTLTFPDASGVVITTGNLADITTTGVVGVGTWNANPITADYGGTGVVNYTAGDLLYASNPTTLSRLTLGAAGLYLRSSGGVPQWSTLSASDMLTGTLPDARLSTNVALLSTNQTFTGAKIFSANAQFAAHLGVGPTAPAYPVMVAASTDTTLAYFSNGAGGSNVTAVYGEASDTAAVTNFGGRFYANGDVGSGVYGNALSTGATTNFGGQFHAGAQSGIGVWGKADNAGAGVNMGGKFETNGGTGRGVYAIANDPANSNLPCYGVRGETLSSSASAYGVYAVGNSGASGTKSFRIDHPDDPANKYLVHYSAESPDVINFYGGTVTIDEHGEATVQLPRYFNKINKDPRYFLTAIGAPMPMLHIAEKISQGSLATNAKDTCRFRIAGGVPGGEVSWEVKAIRDDLWVRSRGAPVEIEKQVPERGHYQHPELYNLPDELGMDRMPAPPDPPAGQ